MIISENILYFILFFILIVLISGGLIAIFIFLTLFISGFQSGVPFVKSKKIIVKRIKESNILKPRTLFCDLGSGDGSFLYELAKAFPEIKFVGYEKNYLLYWFSKIFNRLPNLKFYHQNFFKVDLSQFDYIYLFLFSSLMEKLLPKLKKEIKKEAVIISNTFVFKDWQPIKSLSSKRQLETLHFYQL